MAGWHHWLDGCESEWTLGVGDRQGGLACRDSWGRKESDTTEQLNWNEYVRLFETPWTVAHQRSLSMGFPRQKYWSGLPFPSPGDLSNPGIKPVSPLSPALAGRFFITEPFDCLEFALNFVRLVFGANFVPLLLNILLNPPCIMWVFLLWLRETWFQCWSLIILIQVSWSALAKDLSVYLLISGALLISDLCKALFPENSSCLGQLELPALSPKLTETAILFLLFSLLHGSSKRLASLRHLATWSNYRLRAFALGCLLPSV